NHGIYSGSEYYPSVNGYDLRYKSIECYKTDKVIVDFGSYPEKDSVIFKDKYGVTLKLSKDNVLNFTGVAKPDTNYIYAYRGDEKIGKLSVNTYRQKTYNVVLVSVNGAKLPKISKLEEYLNEVYKQSVVDFEVDTVNFYLPELTSFSHGGSPWNSVYNDDQKRVLRAYNDSIKDGIYYLFFIDNVTDKKDGNGTMVSGYMPRGYNAGFIYDGGSPHIVAHELGHGIGNLEHVFENSSNSGKTKNLMDYSTGEELWYFQWDAIQDPSKVWMKWNKDEEEGENLSLTGKFYAILNGNKDYRLYDKSEITILAGTEIKLDIMADEFLRNYHKSNIKFIFDSLDIVPIDNLGNQIEWIIKNVKGEEVKSTLLPPGKYTLNTKISNYNRLYYNKGKKIN
ncbi:MAG: hypothetical protein IKO36_09700, partial [Bacteroidaceae bacterium]|nr:hypothetical protein [Bacteroidaceae bacterium]